MGTTDIRILLHTNSKSRYIHTYIHTYITTTITSNHLREGEWRLIEGPALVSGADDEHAHVLLLRRLQGQQVAALGARARRRVGPDELRYKQQSQEDSVFWGTRSLI